MAGTFNAWRQPFVVMLTVPLAALGGLIFILLFGSTINIFSQIALIVLIGIASIICSICGSIFIFCRKRKRRRKTTEIEMDTVQVLGLTNISSVSDMAQNDQQLTTPSAKSANDVSN